MALFEWQGADVQPPVRDALLNYGVDLRVNLSVDSSLLGFALACQSQQPKARQH